MGPLVTFFKNYNVYKVKVGHGKTDYSWMKDQPEVFSLTLGFDERLLDC